MDSGSPSPTQFGRCSLTTRRRSSPSSEALWWPEDVEVEEDEPATKTCGVPACRNVNLTPCVIDRGRWTGAAAAIHSLEFGWRQDGYRTHGFTRFGSRLHRSQPAES